jgi:hypothetical protein
VDYAPFYVSFPLIQERLWIMPEEGARRIWLIYFAATQELSDMLTH